MKVTWRGTQPLLMHNERLADPLHPITKKLSSLHKIKGSAKSEAHIAEEMRVEWEGGLYFDNDAGPVLPAWNILAAIRQGGRLSRAGKDIDRAVQITDLEAVPLRYDGPRDLDGMWKAGFYHRCGVSNGPGRKVQRTRPMFTRWSVTFTLSYDETKIDAEKIIKAMTDAGLYVGIGDFRPGAPKGGRYGRFTVEA